jgi:tripartite-type tricarboxylate transporter receptor subunit TctC
MQTEDLMQRTRCIALAIAVFSVASGLTLGASTLQAAAQDSYPSKPIRLVVTTAAGGALDLVARTVAERLSESMGQPLIIENLPAGNGSIAAGQVAKANPDGYTIMMSVDSTLTVNPHLYRNLPYDPFKDFAPVSVITQLPLVLVTGASSEAKTVQELIANAKANPGKLNYASTGVGTQLHIGMELFKLVTKTDIVHVPYRGTTGAMADLMGGRIDVVLIGQSSAKAQAEAGKVLILGIAASKRSPLMPDVPTMAEVGVPNYEVSSWFAMLAPSNTPKAIVDRLSAEIKKAAQHPKFIAALATQGMEIVAGTPEQMLEAMKTTSKKWGDVIAATGTTINQ